MSYYIKQLSKNTVKLCCGGNNCPVVEKIDEDTVKITDDDGNSVVLKNGQAQLIADATKTLSKDALLLG